MILPRPSPQYSAENEAQARRILADEDARNVKNTDYATTTKRGVVRVDGATITAAADGTISALQTTGQNFAPLNAAFVTIGNDPTLTGERALTAGTGISISDGGANGAVTLSAAPAIATAEVYADAGDAATLASAEAYANAHEPAGANPTATASDAAVNGSAATFMRSDAAPAVQKASSSAFGIVKVDGTSITAAGGVISSTGGATGANPTATAKETAINGVAATFMRSDAAPAVQKASSSQFGIVEVDGTTITASGGVISAVSGAISAGAWFSPTMQQVTQISPKFAVGLS